MTPDALDEWMRGLCAALGLPEDAIPAAELLDLTRVVAHGVARPAGPLTTFAIGLAAGAVAGDRAAVGRAIATVRALVDAGEPVA